MTASSVSAADTDDFVDVEIAECLDLLHPRSFFLYAGAGSGKTRSLVSAVRYVLGESRQSLTIRNQRIAIITYTNAAANEIRGRLEFDPLVEVSTIHSFAWRLISEFQVDIRDWMRVELDGEIGRLKLKQSRPGTKAEASRLYRIDSAEERLAYLDEIRRFTYSPTSDNRERDALSHSEVISMCSEFLTRKPVLQNVLVGRHPILFVDESQDTNKAFMEALIEVEAVRSESFALGLFGDTMQRIYGDGKANLEAHIPEAWARPVKKMNHRSALRIVELANRIRGEVDSHVQFARVDSDVGAVRLFICDSASADIHEVEDRVGARMAECTSDPGWQAVSSAADAVGSSSKGVKRLILEHHMAARRLGFATLFSALSGIERERTALLDGSIGGLQLFVREVIPLQRAVHRGDGFEVARIVRERSPLLSKTTLMEATESGVETAELMRTAQAAVDSLMSLWVDDSVPTLRAVAETVDAVGLFVVSGPVRRALRMSSETVADASATVDEELSAWQACLESSFTEVVRYSEYVLGGSPFATHQGVKGLEFPRVMVIMSDEEARGFMFSYEKLLGAKPPSATDEKNALESSESAIDRTRRLFYVTTTRAESSLAIVAYTSSPSAVRTYALQQDWFTEDEIELM